MNPAYDPLDITAYYLGLFATRTDAYSAWSERRDMWVAVRRELTPNVVVQAFSRRIPVAAYTLTPESTGHIAALDFDTDDGFEQATRVGKVMWDQGAPAYIEGSRRGAHLWCSVDERLPAKLLRRALQGYLARAGFSPDPKIELRPGHDELAEGGLGFALRLPTMPHPRVDGRPRFMLTDPRDGQVLPSNLADTLLAIETTPASAIREMAHSFRPPVDVANLSAYHRPPRIANAPDEESASDILRTLWGVQNARPGKAVKCPAHDDKHPSLSILPDDKRVICHAVVCDLNNDGHGRGTYELRQLAFERGLSRI